jgi:TolA-binding protein
VAPVASSGEVPSLDPPRSQSPSRAPGDPEWSKFAREAQYARALELAERSGFERLTRELGENDLLLLANTARYAGDLHKARVALQKVRNRFPRGAAATVSALYLARIAEDHDKNTVEAAHWLSVFLNESPRGGLAADARARLLSLLLKQGNRARAREVAADYLKYHPNGPHAAKARGLLGSSD